MERRKFLVAAASGGLVALAGCTGGDDDSGNGNGNGDENGGENGAENGDENGMENGDENGMENGDENGMENGDENGDENGMENGDENGDENGNGGGGPMLGESVQWTDSFVAEMSFESGQMGSVEATMRFNGGNYYQTMETPQGTFEIYNVDGDLYMVQGGQCFVNPGQAVPDTGAVDPQEQESVTDQQADLTPDGRDTIDGEEMYVYTYGSEQGEVTMYVSVETGRPRRVEFDQGTIDYHSWGNVDPIEPPDMNCQSTGG